jgi:hypothetical protein
MPQLQLHDIAGAFEQLGCTATGLRRVQWGAGVIVELRHASQKSLWLGKRIVLFDDLELRVYEHRSRTNQPEAAATRPQPQPQSQSPPEQEQTTAVDEPDVFSEVASLMRKDAIGTALALLTRDSVAPHTELLRQLILESNLTAPTVALPIAKWRPTATRRHAPPSTSCCAARLARRARWLSRRSSISSGMSQRRAWSASCAC